METSNDNETNDASSINANSPSASKKSIPSKILDRGDSFFVERLKLPDAASLLTELKLFLASFAARSLSTNEQRRVIAAFLEAIYAASLENPAFANVINDDELEFIREGWEKLVMMKLHDIVFGAKGTDEPKMERHLLNKLAAFSWVEERHLDIPYNFHLDTNSSALAATVNELGKLKAYRCPKDKLTVLMNVIDLTVVAIQQQNDTAGNDLLLPVIILALFRAKAGDIISNVNYVLRFRSKTYIDAGQVQYCLTTLMSAITFIYSMTLASLTLDPSERDARKLQVPATYHAPNFTTVSKTAAPIRGSQTHASAFINNNNATASISGFASQMFSTTTKALGETASVLRGAAGVVGGTVDGFAQGLIAGFKEDSSSGELIVGHPNAKRDDGANATRESSENNSGSSVPIEIQSSTRSVTPSLTGSPSGAAKAGTAFANGLKASQKVALKLFSIPVAAISGSSSRNEETHPHSDSNHTATASQRGIAADSDNNRLAFEELLTDREQIALEDYEMQLALALSLSEGGDKVDDGDKIPTGFLVGTSHENTAMQFDEEDDEIPLVSRRKNNIGKEPRVE
ncbi:hypothetical protein HK100_002914 [Physocladia obscura]|uniref:VPS9 domain-containing protein n=1 Tax=Physocladia obscura TaxID=109957 RepID=A0AAD5SXL6_9FUNG|nr:hypothetical protein HK100_002914 [Physocladia obscura]